MAKEGLHQRPGRPRAARLPFEALRTHRGTHLSPSPRLPNEAVQMASALGPRGPGKGWEMLRKLGFRGP